MKTGEKISFAYTGSPQEIVLGKGIYQLEVWGAEGGGKRLSGNSDSGDGGRGGYSKGTITINKKQPLYVYVGGHGISATSTIAEGGYNGGGCAWASSSSEPANGGGGATDIRLVGGNWDNNDGILSRIIVAGAGAGAGGGEDGGFGGGTSGGSQTRPTANSGSDTSATASGGSGYVLIESSYKPTGYIPTSEYYLTDTQLLAGNQAIPNQDGSGTQTGNIGNGFAVITCIESSGMDARCKVNGTVKSVSSMKIKVNGVWKEVSEVRSKINGIWK